MYQTLTFHRGESFTKPLMTSATLLQSTVQANNISVLVVDDEEPLRNLLQISLQQKGYLVAIARNGREALEIVAERKIDLVLLDIMMPELDGFATCIELRKRSDIPVVMLTALNRPDDIVYGFNLGADDYITKPFTFREVEVRLQAILRRVYWSQERIEPSILTANEIVLNDDAHEVSVRGDLVHLTPIEYQLLRFLMTSPDRPISKDTLFQHVWGYDMAGGTNLVEVAMRRLREKIEKDPSQPVYLLTVRGAGYKFNSDGMRAS
jgi:DNA-binding response OmpR family regulator